MPNLIIEKKTIAENIGRFVIEAPKIARKRKAGNFVIVRANEYGERIPLTIVDSDIERGTITLIVQSIGKTTHLLNSLRAGDLLADVIGPLGHPTPIDNFGTVVCIGGGVGAAEVLPIARALKDAGNRVISIIGARSANLLILENEMRQTSDELYLVTDDGSYGIHGLVTLPLQDLIEQGIRIDCIYAIGPMPMMRAVAKLTEPNKIKTFVSLNPVMIDGTGMCGGCRVIVGGKTKFACVDGPEFDAHEVDFDTLIMRNRAYAEQEREAMERFQAAQTAKYEGLV
ncbi:MAG TPA: sulfide/dihydroorotate dehydrogenase-like FAD/NAD-binding protein [Blastocatellia bacterium]|nr:sulfide/dihydroorotate dehydrogenase-like FAD/NAD-binding protein [Blastocatellia bacterium]